MLFWICMLAGITTCLFIAWEDFRSREIHIFWLGAFGLSGAILRHHQWNELFWSFFLTNICLVFLILGTVWLFFRLRTRGPIMDVKLGWGDVVMLVTLSIWLEPQHFLLFYSVSCMVLCLIFVILMRIGYLTKHYPIPLAGFLAIAFLGYQCYYWP